MFSNFFFQKSCLLWDNMKKFGRTRQATVDNIIRRMRSTCWITKATDRTQNTWYLLLFHCNNCYANAPQSYFICTLPSLLMLGLFSFFLETLFSKCFLVKSLYLPGFKNLMCIFIIYLPCYSHRITAGKRM